MTSYSLTDILHHGLKACFTGELLDLSVVNGIMEYDNVDNMDNDAAVLVQVLKLDGIKLNLLGLQRIF